MTLPTELRRFLHELAQSQSNLTALGLVDRPAPEQDDHSELTAVTDQLRAAGAELLAARQELAAAQERSANLERALFSNHRIGTAIGVLMTRQQLTDDEAFTLLRKQSQVRHCKLRDLAEQVIVNSGMPRPQLRTRHT